MSAATWRTAPRAAVIAAAAAAALYTAATGGGGAAADHHNNAPSGSNNSERAAAAVQRDASGAVVEAITGGVPAMPLFRRVSDHFVSEYDPATRNPRWVVEFLTSANTHGDAERTNLAFKEEPGLPPGMRAGLAEYEGSGYDRGHMAPAADHRNNATAMADTFYLTNISPQVGVGFNRDYWARLEKLVRDLTKSFAGVHVATGPVWLPTWRAGAGNGPDSLQYTFPAIGTPRRWIPVPTHFYKVVVAVDGAGRPLAAAAFLLPNDAIPEATPVTSYLVPIAAVEYAAGLSFFPALLDADTKGALDWEAAEGGGNVGPPFALRANYARLLGAPPIVAAGLAPLPTKAAMKATKARRLRHVCHATPCGMPGAAWFDHDGTGAANGSGGAGGGNGGNAQRGQAQVPRAPQPPSINTAVADLARAMGTPQPAPPAPRR